jgi:catalase
LLRNGLEKAGATVYVIAPTGGTVAGARRAVPVDRTVLTTQSVEYDALVVAGGASAEALAGDPYTAVNLGEAFRHHKTVAGWGAGQDVLGACGIAAGLPGVVIGSKVDKRFVTDLIEAIGWHRHWSRQPG